MIAQEPEKCVTQLEISVCWDIIGNEAADPTRPSTKCRSYKSGNYQRPDPGQ